MSRYRLYATPTVHGSGSGCDDGRSGWLRIVDTGGCKFASNGLTDVARQYLQALADGNEDTVGRRHGDNLGR